MSFAHILTKLTDNKLDSSNKSNFSKQLTVQFSIAFVLFLLAFIAYIDAGYHAYFIQLNASSSVLPDRFWEIVTFMGDCNCALAIALLFVYKNPKLAVHLFVAAILAAVISHLLKNGFDALRPAGVLSVDSFHQLGSIVKKNSFPSGHTVTIFVFASSFCYHVNWKFKTVLLFSLAAIIGFSRVAVGAHWPIDVLVGGGLAILISTLSYILIAKWTFFSHKSVYFIACIMFLGSAVSLFTHTGGYELVKETALIIAISTLLFFIFQSIKVWRKPVSN